MSEICRDGRWFGPTHRNLRIHLLTRSRETDRATLRPAVRCVGHIDPSVERCGNESRRCNQIDVKQGAFYGHARDRQHSVDLAKLGTDISMSYLTQDQPSTNRPESLARIRQGLASVTSSVDDSSVCLRVLVTGD